MAELPEHIQKYKSLKKKAKKIADTTELAHSKAFTTAAEAVLKDKEGNIDYELLEKSDVQDKFVQKMVEHYVERANKYFGSKVNPKDRIEVDQLLRTYAGITQTQLEQYLRTHGKGYNLQRHENIRDELMKAVREGLSESASGHLKQEHAPHILKEIKGIEDILDPSRVPLGDALFLHGMYEETGAVTEKAIKNWYRGMNKPEPVFLKKKKEKKYQAQQA